MSLENRPLQMILRERCCSMDVMVSVGMRVDVGVAFFFIHLTLTPSPLLTYTHALINPQTHANTLIDTRIHTPTYLHT